MIESLIDIDQRLFITIHYDYANSFFDGLMPIIRNAKTWIPLYLVFIFLIFKKHKNKGLFILIATILIVALTDQFSAGFIKPYFERLRPCHEPDLSKYIRGLIDCGGQYGFISSHATNHFGLVVIMSWFFKESCNLRYSSWLFFIWALLISFAQIYVGKHYPGDIFIGALSGIFIGWIILSLLQKIMEKN
ncbi:MAG: phosphatase PAP2 family protein [Bacteroidia bacterium]|nr:phosphatase PAP2 family protein [Bacteroidia bacterium]